MKYLLPRKILTVTGFLMSGIMTVTTVITNENKDTITQTLGQATVKVVDKGDGKEDTEYYKSDYDNVGDLIDAGRKTAQQVLEEGTVLLKNDNHALPLKKGAKVSLVGVTGYDAVYGGTGSGTIDANEAINFSKSLSEAGFKVNPELEKNYTSEDWAKYKRGSEGKFGTTTLKINEAPWDVVDAAAGSSFKEYGDAAVFVVGRVGGEGYDLSRKGGDGVDNNDGLGPDYLGLNANELSVLEGLKKKKAAGEISKIIMIYNYAGMLEGDVLKDPDIDAALWVGAVGLGNQSTGKLLSGEASPSGRLPDTMWMDNAMNPVNVNFGSWIYEGADELGVPSSLGTGMYPSSTLASYTVYQEGMYLGYRYTETRYEDYVLGTPNTGDYDYSKVVAYPFGFGLTYADFDVSDVKVKKSGDRNYEVSVKVTNTSDTFSGKYSVPIYISKPYGDYARENEIQVPSVELINYGKTKTLAPGESETLKVTLDEKFFTSYDSHNAKGYVLMDGDYYVIVGGDAHDAVNSLLEAKKKDGIKINESRMDGKGSADRCVKFSLKYDADKYAYSDAVSMLDGESHEKVTNLFDFADINLYEGRGDNHVDYYSRDHWDKVSLDQTDGYVRLTMTEQMAKDEYAQLPAQTGKYNNMPGIPSQYKVSVPTDDGEYPKYGVDAGINLLDMRYDKDGNPISYFDPKWDTFMDQLTYDETVKLISNGMHMTESLYRLGKPATRDENGPNGFGGWAFANGYYSNQGLAYRKEAALGHIQGGGFIENASPIGGKGTSTFTDEADPNGFRKQTGFPANGILAATFNKDLANAVGKIIGEDGLWGGCSGLYGIGLNIHRSPYAGRTCEYFSEDGMLTGIQGAYECQGIESKGVHVYNKHCALNDQEKNRHGICVWVNEQALREVYLRAFELPITEGGAFNTMASFTRFGTQAGAACNALGEKFLRGECGMKGIIVTDAYGDMDGSQNTDPYFEMVNGILSGGCDLPDGSQPKTENHFAKYKTGYSEMAWAMRQAAKRVLYQTAWSNAMCGISSTTKFVKVTPPWKKLVNTLDCVSYAMFAAGLLWTITALVDEKKKAK